MTPLTEHFTLEELSFSDTAVRLGIDNVPPPELIRPLTALAHGLEAVRLLLGCPIHINSGYRSPALNSAVRGAGSSAHVQGYAADFTARGYGSPVEIVNRIAASGLDFDQLIQEGSWVHISIAPTFRRQVLTAHFGPGGTTYSAGA